MIKNKTRGLGRGLAAMIPLPPGGHPASVPQMIEVDQVVASRRQVRRAFDAEALRELAGSIKEHGLLQPVLVTQLAKGYELVAGERRWRAARLAGITRIPALVRQPESDVDSLLLGLIENLQRQDLNPIEEAHGMKKLAEEHGLTQEEIAARLGRNRVSVAHSLRLLNAVPAVQSAVAAGVISAGHGRALVALRPEAQEQGLKVVVGRRLSVRQTEGYVGAYQPARPSDRRRPVSDPSPALVAEEIATALGMTVRVAGTARRGRLTISYESPADLEALRGRLSR